MKERKLFFQKERKKNANYFGIIASKKVVSVCVWLGHDGRL